MRNEVEQSTARRRCRRVTPRPSPLGVLGQLARVAPLSAFLLATALVLAVLGLASPPGPRVTMVQPVALLNPLAGITGGPGGDSGGGGPAPKPKAASSGPSDSGSAGGSAAPKPDKDKAPSGSSDSAPKPASAAKPDAAPSSGGPPDATPAAAQKPGPSAAPAGDTAPPATHPGSPPPAARDAAPVQPDAAGTAPKPAPPNAAPAEQPAVGAPRPPPPAAQGVPPLAPQPGGSPRPIPAAQTATAQGACDAKACAPGPGPVTPADAGSTAQQELLCGTGGAACPAPKPAQAAGTAATSGVSPATWKEAGHTALDGAGMIPAVQELANGANAIWYATEGDWTNAGISAAGMIPIAGDAAIGARLIAKGAKYVKNANELAQTGENVVKGGEEVGRLTRAGDESNLAAGSPTPAGTPRTPPDTPAGAPAQPPPDSPAMAARPGAAKQSGSEPLAQARGPGPTRPGKADNTGSAVSSAGPPQGVRSGWVSRPADNGKGTVYQSPGADKNADSVRIMDPEADARYPNGYVRFYNSHGQPIDLNGKPGGRPDTHIPRRPDGSYDLPKGW